jgi:hypothetical protein
MLINKDTVSLEWSFVQGCFHVDRLEKSITANISAFITGGYCDYVLLGVFESDEAASVFAGKLRESRPDIFVFKEGV